MSTGDAPTGYSLRTATLDDASEMAELVNEVNVAEIGIPLTSAEEIRDELTTPERDEEDTVLLVADDGTLAGYLELWAADAEPFTEIQQLSFVRPALWGLGLNAWLLRLGEERARDKVHRAAAASPVFLRVSRWAENEAAGRLFASLGYTYARTFHEMRMELDGAIPAPEVPDRIAIRAFDRERDARAVHAALTEAFAELGPRVQHPTAVRAVGPRRHRGGVLPLRRGPVVPRARPRGGRRRRVLSGEFPQVAGRRLR
jgi:mycothiol synthase